MKEHCIHHVFEEQVNAAPDAIALLDRGTSISYRTLNNRANRLGRILLDSRDFSGDKPVVILFDRGKNAITAALAVLKAGAFYLPVDPDLPTERLEFILTDSQASLVITQSDHLGLLGNFQGTVLPLDTLDVDTLDNELGSQSDANLNMAVSPNDLAYIIYTSGSTGKPKGAMLPHRGIPNMVDAQRAILGVNASSRILQFFSFAFDASIFEIYMALLNGATLIIEDRDTLMQGAELAVLLREQRVTNIQLPPFLLETLPNHDLPDIQAVLVGGEVYPSTLIERWSRTHKVYNVYGPTECTAWVTAHRVNPDNVEAKVIGHALPNVSAHILDQDLAPVPDGATGELCVSGIGVGIGYWNQPGLIRDRFVRSPLAANGGFLYRTGDLARKRDDGTLEFHGRQDHQVKVRGFRVELGEVEARLSEHEFIREVAVAPRHQNGRSDTLVAFYTRRESSSRLTVEELMRFARQKLPSFMVPAYFVELPDLPRNANNKIDRKALPELTLTMSPSIANPPSDALEKRVAASWCSILERLQADLNENFFDVGGHSLRAVQLTRDLNHLFDVQIKLSEFYRRPQLGELISLVREKLPLHALTGLAQTLEQPIQAPLEARSRHIPDMFALAPIQQRLLLAHQIDAAPHAYNLCFSYPIPGSVDDSTMAQAVRALLLRHPLLRARLADDQIIILPANESDSRYKLKVHADAKGCPQEEQPAWIDSLAREAFSLEEGPLCRMYLARHSERRAELVFLIHHIIFDGWSVNVLSRDLSALYYCISRGIPPELPQPRACYAEYAAWQTRWLDSEPANVERHYWNELLGNAPPVTPLPLDRQRPESRSGVGGRCEFEIAGDLLQELKKLAKQTECTLFSVTLAAFGALLYRYSNEPDMVVGIAASDRTRPEFDDVIGLFVNTLPVLMHVEDNHAFADLVRKVHDRVLDVLDHQSLPFDQIVETARVPRLPGVSPLVQVLFVFQSEGFAPLVLDGQEYFPHDVHNGSSKFDLELQLVERNGTLSAWFEYATDVFEKSTVEQLISHFVRICHTAVTAGRTEVGAIELMAGAELRAVVGNWNQTDTPLPSRPFIHQAISATAQARPDAPAVFFEGRSISYQVLDRSANALAHRLVEAGVGPNVPVAVMMERSLELVIALLAILKAGGAYVPVDPDYPEERRNYMIMDSDAPIVLIHPQFEKDRLKANAKTLVLNSEILNRGSTHPPTEGERVAADDLCYIIYTSGSTGLPKGAMNSHRAVFNRLNWMQEKLALGNDDAVLQKTPYSFDVSVWEFFWPLIAGARLVVAQPGGHRDTSYLRRLIETQRITTMHFVPSMLRLFLEDCPSATRPCPSLRQVVCSGEALDLDLQQAFFDRFDASLYNLYGPTEAAIDVTWWQCVPQQTSGTVPIGTPIDNARVYVLDARLRPVPIGAKGELYLGGVCVGSGYWKRDQLTAERFISDPFSAKKGARMYRTGDLVQWRCDGQLLYLGRCDNQVKLHGLRVELGEIESALRTNPNIKDVATALIRDSNGVERLGAWLVMKDTNTNNLADAVSSIRATLRKQLPEFMVPSTISVIDSLPLTPSGKLDRAALSSRANAQHAPVDNSPLEGEVEHRVAEIWQEALSRETIGPNDNFFDCGGHSLLATRLVMALRREFHVELPVRLLFEAPTVRAIADEIVHTQESQRNQFITDTDIDLEREAQLGFTLPSPTRQPDIIAQPKTVLLTGATGFLGAYLLRELLVQTEATVHCLVRAPSEAQGMERIQHTLNRYGKWHPEYANRIVALPGDLSRPYLGMSQDCFDVLASRIDAIYHNGAWVNFIEPYYRLHGPNVNGTRECLRLAFTHHAKPFHYVSSNSIFGTVGHATGRKVLYEGDNIRLGIGHHYGGYVKTKWVAEQMVWNAHALGLPVTVYRCGLVLGDSHHGTANPDDFISRLIKGCIQLGKFYRLRNKYDNFVPVDFASAAIVHLSRQQDSNGLPFHVVNPRQIPYSQFWKLISDHGYSMAELDYRDWKEELYKSCSQSENNPLFPLLPLFIEEVHPTPFTIVELFQDVPLYDTSNLENGLRGSGIVCPPIDQKLVSTWLRFYIETGFIAPPRAPCQFAAGTTISGETIGRVAE